MPASRPGDVVDKPAASRADGHRPPARRRHSGWRCRPRSAARPARCPRGLPTEKVSRATRSPGRAAKGRTRTGRFLAAVVRIPVAAAVSWARAATRWARRPSRWRPRSLWTPTATDAPVGRPGGRPAGGRPGSAGRPPQRAPPRPGRVGSRSALPAAGDPWAAARPARSVGRGRPSGRRSCGRSRRCGRPRPRWSARPGPGPGHAGGR